MKKLTKALSTLIAATLLLSFGSMAYANEPISIMSDSAQISIITCSPGTEIYELFGHSAIRIYDKEQGIDEVFNYGLFDFNQDDFIYRFVRGKTDYMVGSCSTNFFLWEYLDRGSAVTEDVLNLSRTDKLKIAAYLLENTLPENRTYRYNFIFNNCATKLRDILVQNIDGKINFIYDSEYMTFRDAIKMYTQTSPWSQFGFDLCLGKGMDREATTYEKMFLPEILGKAVANATVTRGDTISPLTIKKNQISEQTLVNPAPLVSPMTAFILLCIAVAVISVWSVQKKRFIRWFDAIFFGVNALFGCVILFLILFSKHPFTGANYNIIWLNPLMCLPIVFLFAKKLLFYEPFYYMLVSIVLTLFLIASFAIEQEFNPAIYPLVTAYLIRAASYVIRWGYKLDAPESQR